jgi:hypothetical protein
MDSGVTGVTLCSCESFCVVFIDIIPVTLTFYESFLKV